MEQENLQSSEELIINNNETSEITNDETGTFPIQEESTSTEPTTIQEPPTWDFASFNTEEIISHMKELIQQYPIHLLRALDTLPPIFDSQFQKEYELALQDYTEAGNSPESFEYKNDSKERFYSVYRSYREQRTAYYKKVEEGKEENLNTKLQIIEEIKQLTQNEESINKTFQEFRNLQERWKNTGPVPQNRANDVQETYHVTVEKFYNYIQINRELRDLDWKKNLELKTHLCEEAEQLLEANNIGNAFKQLQLLHARWKEIGPVASDQKEIIWARFKEISNKINNAYHNFLNSLKEEQSNNLKIKEDICEKMEILAQGEYTSAAQWNQMSTQAAELQEEWKRSGFAPLKDRKKILKRYKTACDHFYERKRNFYQEYKNVQENNLALKLALCEKAEAIKESTDWHATKDQFITYQQEWNKIGPVPKNHSKKINKRFEEACNYFFNNRKAFYKTINGDQQENLKKKKVILDEMSAFAFGDDHETNLQVLKEFQTRWMEADPIPSSHRARMQDKFQQQLDTYFNRFGLNNFDKELEKFKLKLSIYETDKNQESKIIQEREALTGKIRRLERDLNTQENNISFFSKSGNSQGFVNEFMQKIENMRNELIIMRAKLKILDRMI